MCITSVNMGGGYCGVVVSVFDCGPTGRRFESFSHQKMAALTFCQWSMTKAL